MKILVLNCGSSSVKFQFIETEGEHVLAKGIVEKIGSTGAFLRYSRGSEKEIREVTEVPNHDAAITLVLQTLMHPRDGVISSVDEIAGELSAIGDAALVRRFLESILTPREREEIAGRWELVKLLHRGESQRNVAERLGMSLCKITRGSRELKKKDSAFKAVLERYERRHRSPEGGRE